MSGTRIRPDKQIQTAPGPGYVLHSDNNGELQFALLAALAGNGNSNFPDYMFGDVHTIDSIQLLGNTLVLRYTNNQNVQFVKSCDLTSLAVDVKVTGAFLQHLDANTYVLQLTQSDGTTVTVNLSELLAVVTVNSADIIFSGNGTATNPLTAVLSDSAKSALNGGTHWTDQFINLTTGNSVQLSYTPIYPFPILVSRNGLDQAELYEWRYNAANPKVIYLQGASFGANGQPETVIVHYKTLDHTTPRQPLDYQPQYPQQG
ncbi:MAG: hypothetical protein JST06_08980 [Bacteroidetes bacterium]|nr:hypothetical protein [Bacteroidota bacterium]MBS1628690.1 hypothetical protein [Bacteroidota bacterium]